MKERSEQGQKMHDTLLQKLGSEEAVTRYWQDMGRAGGRVSRGGFMTLTVGKDGMTGPERARAVAAKGGRASRRKTEGAA